MAFVKNHYETVVQPDLVLAGIPISAFVQPYPVKIVLTLNSSKLAEDVLRSSVILELIGYQKSYFCRRISNGEVIGSSVTLRSDKMYNFLSRILFEVLPRLKQFEGFRYPKHPTVYTFLLKDLLLFEGVAQVLNLGDSDLKDLRCEFYFNTVNSLDILILGRLLAVCFHKAT